MYISIKRKFYLIHSHIFKELGKLSAFHIANKMEPFQSHVVVLHTLVHSLVMQK